MAKELGLDKTHPDVQKIYLAVYKSFMEVKSPITAFLGLPGFLKFVSSCFSHLTHKLSCDCLFIEHDVVRLLK